MKRIFGILLAIGLAFSFVGKSFAKIYEVDGKVRYAIELKKMTAAEAQVAFNQGYVDLWAYAYFSQEFVDDPNGMITVSNGKITGVKIQFTPTTHAYQIQDKYGNLDKSQKIARFAPTRSRGAECGRSITQGSMPDDAVDAPSFVSGTCCPEWYFGASAGNTKNISSIMAPFNTDIIVDDNGTTWYRIKLYPIRYEWLSMQSFYTSFYSYESNPADRLGCETDASTFTISYDGQTDPIKPPKWNQGDNQDWSIYVWNPSVLDPSEQGKDRCAYIMGGVEIESDPEMTLTAGKTCGGEDLSGTFSVKTMN
ncbi:MAG: hypothetical protein NC324_10965, partial [Bacteroides sp.]|nr:hypothetical protein [Bacteroides sp.]